MTIKLVGATSGSVALDAPASTTSGADITFKLPVADGSANQLLKTDGSGNLSWASDTEGKLINMSTTTVTAVVSHETTQGSIGSSPLISLTYAAASSSNKLLILASISIGMSSTAKCGVTLYEDSSASAYRGDASGSRQRVSSWTRPGSSSRLNSISLNYVKTSPSTSSVVYGLRSSHAHDGTQTVYMNGAEEGNHDYEARAASTMTILEIAP